MQTTLRRTGHTDIRSSDSVLCPEPVIDKVWQDAAPLIQRVLDRMDPNDTLEALYEELKNCDRQLWTVWAPNSKLQAVILTMIQNYRDVKYGYLTHAAGEDFKAWESLVEPISRYFKILGCDTMRIVGRRGWKRYLEPRGFKEVKIVLERSL